MTRDVRDWHRHLEEAAFSVEELPYVDSAKLDLPERAAIERAIIERERLVTDLQSDLLELRSERDTLDQRVSRLETERSELRDRIEELRASRPAIEPKRLLADLGSAFEGLDERDSGRFTVSDIGFELKANVTQSEEGVRLHLPSLDERSAAAENLSELSFTVRSKPPSGTEAEALTEIPEITGIDRQTAARRLASVGLEVGDVGVVDEPRLAPGTVVEQFPEPMAVAPPGSPVDLVVVETASDGAEDDAETDPAESETGDERPDRSDDDRKADDRAGGERRESIPLEAIEGIGPTYAGRLDAAGIEDVAELVRLDPETVAKITNASKTRAETWLERAKSMVA
jgi:predicted flap endonuclease-1-like 5' DNA nuclease